MCPIFSRLSGENRDITMTLFRTTKISNRFYKSKIDCKIVSCDHLKNQLQSTYLIKSIKSDEKSLCVTAPLLWITHNHAIDKLLYLQVILHADTFFLAVLEWQYVSCNEFHIIYRLRLIQKI